MIVTVDGTEPLKSIYCPSHPADIRRTSATRAVATWSAHDAWPDSDFSLLWSRGPSALGIQLLTSRASGDDRYPSPRLSGHGDRQGHRAEQGHLFRAGRTSGSMAGVKLTERKRRFNSAWRIWGG